MTFLMMPGTGQRTRRPDGPDTSYIAMAGANFGEPMDFIDFSNSDLWDGCSAQDIDHWKEVRSRLVSKYYSANDHDLT